MLRRIILSGASIVPCMAMADVPLGDLPLKIYGVADFGVKYSHSNAGDDHDFQSGIASTSRLGLKLNSKINDDFNLIGNVESGIDIREGEFLRDKVFNRAANIGIQSKKYGTLLYGLQYSAAIGLEDDPFLAVTAFSPYVSLGASSSGIGAGSTSLDSRANHAISYTSPNLYNIKTEILYTPNQAVTKTGANAKNFGIMSIYDDEINRVGFSYNELTNNNAVTYEGRIYQNIKTRLYNSTFAHTIYKVFKLSGGFSYYKPNSPDAVSVKIYNVGLIYNQPKYSIRSSIYQRKIDAQDKLATGYAIGAEYHLNKYLDAYVRAGYLNNNKHTKYTINYTTLAGNGDDPSSYATGLRFRF